MIRALRVVCLIALLGAPAMAQVNLQSGLMAHYPFNGNFNDISGQGNHGTAMNGATFAADQWGMPNRAAFFDGTNDWVSVPPAASLTPGHHFSIAFRFKTTSSALQMLFSKSDFTGYGAPDNYQYQIGFNGGSVLSSNALFFSTLHNNVCVTSSFWASDYLFGANTTTNQWTCVLLSFENGVKKVYVNGALINSRVVTGTANNTSIDSCSAGGMRIGTWWQNDPRFFSGFMDDVRIWNRSLNAAEIDSLCKETPVPELITAHKPINLSELVTYPTPASGDFKIVTEANESAAANLVIRNALGQAIFTRTVLLQAGRNEIMVSPADLYLAAGHYLVQLTQGGQVSQQRIVIR